MIKMLRWFLSILWNRFESCLQHLDVMNSLQYDLQLRQFARLQVSRQQRLQFLHVSSTDIACVKLQSVQPETHDYCWWLTIVEMLILILLWGVDGEVCELVLITGIWWASVYMVNMTCDLTHTAWSHCGMCPGPSSSQHRCTTRHMAPVSRAWLQCCSLQDLCWYCIINWCPRHAST